MSIHFWSFLAGAFTLSLIQWLVCIPEMRKHRMKMALLVRADVYQKRAKAFSEAGQEYEALKAWAECMTLLNQVKAIK